MSQASASEQRLLLRLRQQELLAELGTHALETANTDTLLQEACRLAADGLGTPCCKIMEYLPAQDCFLIRAGVGWRDGVVGHSKADAGIESPTGHAFKTGIPVISRHLAKDGRFRTPQLLREHGIESAINVVIRCASGPFGVLEVDSRNPGAFVEEDIAFLQAMANFLGIAIARERTEEAREASRSEIQENERRLSIAVRASHLGLWELDLETGALTASEACKAHLGLPASAPFSYGDFLTTVHPDDGDRVQHCVSHALETGGDCEMECRIITLDGNVHWIQVRGRPVRDGDGHPSRMVGVSLDITGRKQTEEALRAAHQQTSEILESISDAFYALDGETRFVYVNRKAATIWGKQPHDLLGRRFLEVFPQVAESPQWRQHEQVLRERQPLHFERASAITGNWLTVNLYPAPNGGITVYFRDVSARKRDEEAAREQAALLRTITDNTAEALFMMDAEGRITFMNPAAERMFGWRQDELRGVVLHDVLHHHHADGRPFAREECPLRQVLASHRSLENHEDVLFRRDGAPVPIACSNAPIISGGQVLGAVLAVRDITERKRAEAERQRFTEMLEQRVAERTRELAEANARLTAEMAERRKAEKALLQAQRLEAIGQLTGGVAHDFNNLLTAVMGNLELLRPRQPDEKSRRQLDIAMRAARRGGELTHQLLAYARKQHLEPRPVDANAVIVEMDGLLRRSLGARVQVETSLEPDLWHALSDPTQLELVVLNLAINARDAMPKGGCLRIGTRNLARGDPGLPSELAPGDYVLISVADEGTGMSPEVLDRALEPFFTTKEVGKGSGLGLAQVYGLARQFGGTVRLRSQVGRGTTVEVLLPRTEAEPDNAISPAVGPDDSGARQATILVLDDDPDVRAIAVAFLRETGYRVRQAESADEALSIVSHETIALALVDYAMPGKSGAEFARQARQLRPGLPITYVTGNPDAMKADEQPDRDPVVTKPYQRSDLLRAVREGMAERARAVRPDA